MATVKQRKVTQILLENAGMSIGKAMLKAGYSPNTAKNPQELTKSKGWINLISVCLSDEKLITIHNELLYAVKTVQTVTYTNKKTKKVIHGFVEVPDWQIRLKSLELAYKLKRFIK